MFNLVLSGIFNGKYWVVFVYWDQNFYQIYVGVVDFCFGFNSIGKWYKDVFGVGVVFYNDWVLKFGFFNNQINVVGVFYKSLSKFNDQFLSVGFQAGLVQCNFGYECFNFEDQFGGDEGYINLSVEILFVNNFVYGDILVGINYIYVFKRGVFIYVGAVMYYILELQISFFYNEDELELGNFDFFYCKYIVYVNVNILVGLGIQIQLWVLLYVQGFYLVVNVGSNICFLIDEILGVVLYIGGWVCLVWDELDNFMFDVVVGMVGIEFSNFLLGLSYDVCIDGIGFLFK